ncbi:hypothetical protein JCM5350_006267 [Sporobolomyces pararoseus]
MSTRVARPLVPSPTNLSPSLRKHHRHEYDDDSDTDYSDDDDDDEEQPKASGSSSSTPKPVATPTTARPTTETIAYSSPSSIHRSNTTQTSSRTSPTQTVDHQDSKPTKSSSDAESGPKPSPSSTSSDNDAPSSSSTSTPTPSNNNPSSSIVPQDLLDVLLKTHNDFRALHSTPPLEWNDTLAESSDRWVDNCVWEHSGGKLLEGGYGENLFATSGTNSAQDTPVDGKAGVDAWNDEIKMYTYDPPTGFTHETG